VCPTLIFLLVRHQGMFRKCPPAKCSSHCRQQLGHICAVHRGHRFSTRAAEPAGRVARPTENSFTFGKGDSIRRGAAAIDYVAVAGQGSEAVVWISAMPELLVLFFLGFLNFVNWLQSGRVWAYPATLLCFVAALLSKESAIALIPFRRGNS
jgi:hypothetical protein